MGSEFGVCVCVCKRNNLGWRHCKGRTQESTISTYCYHMVQNTPFASYANAHTHTHKHRPKEGTLCARPTNLQARESVLLHPPLLNRGQPLEDNCGGLLMFSMIKLRRSSQGSRQFLYFMSQPQPTALVPHESGPNTENKMNDGFNYCP